MFKKILGYFCYLILVFVIYLEISQNTQLFVLSENPRWNVIRYVGLSWMLSVCIICVLILIVKRKVVYPYLKKLYKFKPLLYQLVKRDFKTKYKRSVLGVLWSILNPLLTMAVMTIVFSTLFRFEIENYPVYLLSGQIIFTLYSEVTSTCMFSILAASSLMKKVNMPKYIFPLSKAISALINFLFSTIALLMVMIVTGSPIHLSVMAILLPTIYISVFSTGVGMILATLVVFFRDMSHLYNIFLMAIMYLTPIFYPISIVPENFRWMISINPLYHFVECFRTVVIYGALPTMWQNMVCSMFALVSLVLGMVIFYKKQDTFILYV